MASLPAGAEAALRALQSVGSNLHWDHLPNAVKEYTLANPGFTAVQLVLIISAMCPGLIAGPVLLGLGFSSTGPVAGSAAAGFQAVYGTPVIFSALQSAAMGGWGVATVNGVVQGAFLAGASFSGFFNRSPRTAAANPTAKR